MEKIKIHCLTNPVTMQDVANILLAAGGSPIMGQDPEEAEEIARLCQAVLLNTGVPDERKFQACILAGKTANMLGHPVVLDPVGAGASVFREKGLRKLLQEVHPDVIRCNAEEAWTLYRWKTESTGFTEFQGKMWTESRISSGGVDSSFSPDEEVQIQLALALSSAYGCTALISGKMDVVSDGVRIQVLTGGSEKASKITGTGCMLSALCALFSVKEKSFFEGTAKAAELWKKSQEAAEKETARLGRGIGTCRVLLFDFLEALCGEKEESR